jgi:outer membrane scaffolding protein for murein synthesis (MipA/OmpV family)
MKHVKKKLLTSALMTIGLGFINVAFAETPISDAYSPGESKSKWIVGANIALWDNPYINEGDDNDDEVDDGEFDGAGGIRVEYRGERFFVDNDGLGLTLLRSNGFSSGIVLTGNAGYLTDEENFEDNDRLNGIEERDPTVDLGVYLIHNHKDGQFKLTVLQEVTNEHDGQTIDARYSYNFPVGKRWNVTPVFGLAWASDDTVNHFFGVSETESANANNIAAYEGDSALNVYGGVNARFDITEHWDINFGLMGLAYGEGIKDSPLIEDDSTAFSHFGVSYNF